MSVLLLCRWLLRCGCGCERAEEKEAVINRTNHAIGRASGTDANAVPDMGGDGDLGSPSASARSDSIRFDGVSTLLFLFDLLL